MSTIKQHIIIAKKNKIIEVEKELLVQRNHLENVDSCESFEIYQSDDEGNEFLVYQEWSSKETYDTYLNSNMYQLFEEKIKPLMIRKEELNLL